MKKAKVDNAIYNVIDKLQDINMYDTDEKVALEMPSSDLLYPIHQNKQINQEEPGVYLNDDTNNPFNRIVEPNENNMENYTNENLIDFTSKSTREIIEKGDKLRRMERSILLDVGNVFVPIIREEDEPETAAFKQAVIAKQIDIDKYKDRIGSTYSNDKRLFNENSITLQKMKSFCNALDIDLELRFSDKKDAPNPMGKDITVKL